MIPAYGHQIGWVCSGLGLLLFGPIDAFWFLVNALPHDTYTRRHSRFDQGAALFEGAEELIDEVNEAIEAFMLADETVIENFVPCDFHLVDQALTWMKQNHWLVGNRFCEFGAGFGAAAMLASLRGMEACGIEVEERLVDQATMVADRLSNEAKFYQGSFVPRGVEGLEVIASEVKNVDTQEDDVYEEIGLDVSDFDLFFAFPWPGEHPFFEHVFEACATDGALLLTYRGRDGMHLVRKGE